MDETILYQKHFEFHSNLDYINTTSLSRIKEISKRINFASISSDKQVFNNKGNLYHREKNDIGDYISNLTLDYIIIPKEIGVIYGIVNTKISENDNGEEEKKATFKSDAFNNYARFIADVISDKVIYSNELDSFLIVKSNTYEVIDETNFALNYPVDNKHQINDFLEVMIEMYRDHLKIEHGYNILPYTIAGNNWIYDCRNLEFRKKSLNSDELYVKKYDVDESDIDTDAPRNFYDLVTENDKSKNNLMLVHAYTMYRKMQLIQAEKWMLMKDFGRSGKGLFMTTFDALLQVNKVNFDSLISGGFEASNEWMNFYGADIAHANETGEITKVMMRILRKIATGEVISGRGIGRNAFTFKNNAVLILDTNESVDTGEITANTTRTIKISLKDRPLNETDEERYQIFKPYWDFVQPNGKKSVAAAVSFLITSLEYLKEIGREFKFNDVTLKHYFSEDELTETQVCLLKALSRQNFIFSGDETLQKLIEQDYKSLRYKQAKDDMKKIGISINNQKKIDGVNTKVHKVGNPELFNMAVELITEE
ncbi:phage resistance protein [Staphylococcus saprophyticus]|uniref:phage resistance protein n=1 Tax=Staphylococcus saprophyticus TaxID=29385 RepID=UPI0022EB7C5C|nr:phage resistance protein [Staphylococcus saprophyticus]MDW4225832.1 phage resistance protein [Staphylococcus saprophyticus]MDW4246592.1 phage resistance protein [Staphylococcus saprophyticus]MDW4258921.1 phage resistance protein [Staphylococcus saprophyticus]MDW4324122.1 phage resistance protein [Staphylococcus saprophyticus]MDW4331844.1 phage resistance protein [Staphylococcus saprophyticus]